MGIPFPTPARTEVVLGGDGDGGQVPAKVLKFWGSVNSEVARTNRKRSSAPGGKQADDGGATVHLPYLRDAESQGGGAGVPLPRQARPEGDRSGGAKCVKERPWWYCLGSEKKKFREETIGRGRKGGRRRHRRRRELGTRVWRGETWRRGR